MKKIIYICSLFFISACSSNTQSTWSCPILEGGKGSCASIKEADLLESGTSEKNKISTDFISSSQKIEIKLMAPKLKDLKKLKQEDPKNAYAVEPVNSGSKLRTQEKVGQIWFAPYIDSEGNQHSEKVIHVVDEEAKWVGQR
jgi:type IV conjugative transfer system lipoprotein TraV